MSPCFSLFRWSAVADTKGGGIGFLSSGLQVQQLQMQTLGEGWCSGQLSRKPQSCSNSRPLLAGFAGKIWQAAYFISG
jgi:hypothetical protein